MTCYSSFSLLFLCLYGISFTKALNSGFTVELIHRDSPKSPFYFPIETQFQRVYNTVRRSINHANHFNKPFSNLANVASSIIIPDKVEYLMSYSIGTPPFHLYGVVDTGSSIIWLQCVPCQNCYNQTSPIFDPSNSTTYKIIPCSSAACYSVGSSCSLDNEQRCQYGISYMDSSKSIGDFSLETLTLNTIDGSPFMLHKTMIGCGHINTLHFFGKTSGIVGLGPGPTSLVSQLGLTKFSYCLVPLSQHESSSKLIFGYDDMFFGNGVVSTPMFPKHLYYLTLEAISVGNNRLEFGDSLPSNSDDKKGNIIIDSGTTLTFLPYDLYSRLESAIKNVVQLERVEGPPNLLSLCYKVILEKSMVPIITAHFSGADVQLNSMNTFVLMDVNIACLAFSPTQTTPVFGNLAQQNFLVGYDLQKNIVSFKRTDCTKY
ncbi:hypothetical protein Lal_00040444 [Lupinus albus]|uniref:Putative nepenthesin n=1 Tax=Lupinus albus TaxID=3870 RepID=A0A6A4R3A8_LUPAL|nr:putative nepenthesin [Lupinus albus]KAF1877726.1 hypothetical protein Lal_00040444 [Lupinus albus]